MVQCPSTCLFVCQSVYLIRTPHFTAAGLLLWAWQAEGIDWLLSGTQQ